MNALRSRLNVLAAALVIGCSSGRAANDAQLHDSNEIWESMLAAKGGRSRLESVHTLVFRSTMERLDWSASDVAGGVRYDLVVAFPNQMWAWEDYRPGTMGFGAEVIDLSRGIHWFATNGAKAKQLAIDSESEPFLRRRIEELQILYLLETRFLKPRLASATSVSKGDSVILAVETPEHVRVEYTVDTRRWLPTSVRLFPRLKSGPGSENQFVFDGEQEVSGLRMPRRVRWGGEVSFIVNPAIDPGLFTTRPDGVTSRDEWRRWLVHR